MRKGLIISGLCLMLLLIFAGCRSNKVDEEIGQTVYYVNTDLSGLVKESYSKKSGDAGKEVENVLERMREPSDSTDAVPAIPPEIEVRGITIDQKQLLLDFNQAYAEMDNITEILCREAIVRSLTQVYGVEAVAFSIDQEPLQDKYGNLIGYMKPDDFIQNTGSAIHSYQMKQLTLYFSNEDGDKLVSEKQNVRYNSNMSLEKLVLERMAKGPSEKGHKATLKNETKILGVSVKDGICYINFDESFLKENYDVQPKVVIQSIVNSITELGDAAQVQILVNGESSIVFQGTEKLDYPLDRNLDLLEESKSD